DPNQTKEIGNPYTQPEKKDLNHKKSIIISSKIDFREINNSNDLSDFFDGEWIKKPPNSWIPGKLSLDISKITAGDFLPLDSKKSKGRFGFDIEELASARIPPSACLIIDTETPPTLNLPTL